MGKIERNILLGFAISFIVAWIGFRIRNSNLAYNMIEQIKPNGIIHPAQISVTPRSDSRGRRLMKYQFSYNAMKYEHSDPRLFPCKGREIHPNKGNSSAGIKIYILLDTVSLEASWALLTEKDYELAGITPKEGYYFDEKLVCY